jgi:protein involved in polysaccharide export with SLBB domain
LAQYAIIAAIASLTLVDLALAHQQFDVIAVGGHVKKPGPYDRIENETMAALLNRIGGIPVSHEELERYQYGETGFSVRINLYRDGKKRELKIDPKNNELWELLIMKNDVIEVAGTKSIEADTYPSIIILKKEVEQGGAVQPATRPELESGGSDKTQPESEGRSR